MTKIKFKETPIDLDLDDDKLRVGKTKHLEMYKSEYLKDLDKLSSKEKYKEVK